MLAEVLNFQDDLSVSGSGTVVIHTPKGSQSSAIFRDQSNAV
jgi:serine/threonine-protein kinase 24/25/MST4